MHAVDQGAHVLHRCSGQDAMAEIEDVAGATASLIQDSPRARREYKRAASKL